MATSVSFDVYAKDRASKTFTNVGGAASKSEGHLAGLKKTLVAVGAGFAAMEVARKAGEFLKGSAEAAITDQAAQKSLALALSNTTNANKDQIAGVNDWLSAQSVALGFNKAELQPAFQKLAQSTGSVTKAQAELKLAMDVSAGTGRDLASVSLALTKANNGSVTGLSRMGIATKVATDNTAAIKTAQISAQTAQLAYTKAVKDYGPASTQAKIAGEKLAVAQGKVTTAQKTTATTTLTLNQALKSMSDTFGGQAQARTKTFQGTMDRLHATFHEFEIEVGNKMLPVLTQFGNWLINKGLPAAAQFGTEVDTKLKPTMILLRKEFARDSPTVTQFTKAIQSAGPPVARLTGNILSLGQKSDSKGTPALLRFGNAIENKLVYSRLSGAISGLGMVSSGILNVGGAAQRGIRAFDNWEMGAEQSVKRAAAAFGSLPGKIRSAVGDLSHLLYGAGQQVVGGLVSGIESKVGGLLGSVSGIAGKVSGAFSHALGIHSPSRVFIGHGANIIEGLIKGIQSKQVALATVLSKVTAAVQAAGAKLQAAIGARNQFASGFQSFSSSAFGADYGTDDAGNPIAPTAASIIAYQRQQRAQAHTVKTDVRKLVKMGLSPALIKQLQSQGAAGIPEIEALAGASRSQIRQYNSLNKQTSRDLQSAGMSAANRLYGKEIKHDRQADHDVKHLLTEIRDALKHMDHKGPIVVRVDGDTLDLSLAKVRKRKGHLQSDKKP